MKRIYSFMFAAVVLLAAASCQKEMTNELGTEGNSFSFTATIGTDTKTVLDEGNKVNWSVGDNISVFDNENTPKTFKGQHTEETATAVFHADDYTPAETIYAIYPAKADATFDGTKIDNLRIANAQEAVAGSFDPNYAVLVGTETEKGSGLLNFKNVHALLKFTIGGETAPTSVTLTNNGAQAIAGLFAYNPATPIATSSNNWSDEAKTITLTPKAGESFEIGQTYYIVFRGGCNLVNLTLKFDGVVVKEKIMTIEYEVTPTMGKIFDMGTVSFPEVTEEPVVSAINVTRVWGHYGEGSTAWSNSLVSSLDGNDRNLAMDDEYIYIPETNTSGNIHKFKVSDGTYVGTLPIIDDLKTGTHYTSCARMVKNSDPAINGGKDVLVVCNLAQSSETLVFVAYTNGTDNAPVKIWSCANTAGRRFGDKFTAFGDYVTAKYWVRTYQGDDTMTAYAWPGNNWTWLNPDRKNTDSDKGNIGELAWYPGQDSYCLISTTSGVGAHLMNGANEVKTYPALAKTFGYNFFEAAGEKFVAWTSLFNGNDKPRLQIVQSDASTLTKMQATFDNLATRLVYEAPLQNADDMNTAGVAGGHTVCDCCVREINGEIYIAAMAQKAGLSLFKVTAK